MCSEDVLSVMVFTGQQIVRNLRESLFSSILRQEVGFFDKTRTGELINRLSADTAVVGRALTDNLSDGLRSVAQATAGVSMMVSSMLMLAVYDCFMTKCKVYDPFLLPTTSYSTLFW